MKKTVNRRRNPCSVSQKNLGSAMAGKRDKRRKQGEKTRGKCRRGFKTGGLPIVLSIWRGRKRADWIVRDPTLEKRGEGRWLRLKSGLSAPSVLSRFVVLYHYAYFFCHCHSGLSLPFFDVVTPRVGDFFSMLCHNTFSDLDDVV